MEDSFIRELQEKVHQSDSLQPAADTVPILVAGHIENQRTTLQEDVTTWLGDVDTPAQHSPEPRVAPAVEANNEISSSPSSQLMNPLAIDAGNYMADIYGKPIHLGTSSNWSFGRRVLRMSCERLKTQLPTDWLHFEGAVYRLDWNDLKVSSPPTIRMLPSTDHAVYLINAVKFHCGQLFHLFDEESFMQQFSVFHDNNGNVEKVPNLWYIHYLLILALGKAFMAKNVSNSCPPGTDLFMEAMRRLPEIVFFPTDPVQAIELLVCAALYLQCLDFRNSAYNLIGQAQRKALEQGMHTRMSSQELSQSRVERCRRVWWTVYMLDRQMSSLMGLPMNIRDDDISAKLPTFAHASQRAIGLELHVRLSRIIADIMNSELLALYTSVANVAAAVYSTEGRIAKRYLISTKQALKTIANVTNLLRDNFELPDRQSMSGISRLAAHLHLLHHQCICLTTRPLAYSFLERRLRSHESSLRYSVPRRSVRALLKTCIESGLQMLHILTNLQNEGLLESFLPFDLEAVFTSTIILIMSNTIDPSLLEGSGTWSETAYSLLDEMASRGNLIAAFRRQELQQLASVLDRVPAARTAVPSGATTTAVDASATDTLVNAGHEDARRIYGARAGLNAADYEDPVWQDELSAEQLMLLADTLDLDGLDWVASSMEESSILSQGFAIDT